MDDTAPTSTGSGIRLARFVGASTSRGGSFGYSIHVLGAWSVPLALGLALAAWRFLIVEFTPFVFAASVVLVVGFGLLVIWSGRRAAMRVLRAIDSPPDRRAWVLVPSNCGCGRRPVVEDREAS